MHGRRSLNIEITPLNPDLERHIKKAHRAHIEMGDNQRNANMEEQEDYQDARVGAHGAKTSV